MQGRAAVRLARLRRAASVQTVEQLAPLHDYLSLNCAIRKALTDRTQALLTARTLEAEVKAKTAKVGIDRVELKRAERKSRSREAALSKTDVMILRLFMPHNHASSAPWSSPPSLQRSIAWPPSDTHTSLGTRRPTTKGC